MKYDINDLIERTQYGKDSPVYQDDDEYAAALLAALEDFKDLRESVDEFLDVAQRP